MIVCWFELRCDLYAEFICLETGAQVHKWLLREETTFFLPPYPGLTVTVRLGGSMSQTGLELTVGRVDNDLTWERVGVVSKPYDLTHEEDGGKETISLLLQDPAWKVQDPK